MNTGRKGRKSYAKDAKKKNAKFGASKRER